MLQFVLVQVGPAPDASVDDMGEALSPRNLQAPVEGSLNGDTFARVSSVRRDGGDQ